MREFLSMVGEEELIDRGVLRPFGPHGHILQGESLNPLMRLMRDRNVEVLTHGDRWSLNVNEDFVNRTARSPSPKFGKLSQLHHRGHLFTATNPVMNPFYIRNPENRR